MTTETKTTTATFGVTDDVDRDVDALDGIGPDARPQSASAFDALAEEIRHHVEIEPLTTVTPARPGWKVRYRCDIDGDKLQAFRRKCKDRSQAEGYDDIKFAAMVLADQCEAIIQGDAEVLDESGERVTFRHAMMRERMGGRAISAVRQWYGRDGDVAVTAGAVMRQAGFDEEADLTDPMET